MIRIDNLHLRQGKFALEGIDLVVPEGKYAVLMGKTGSGKSTVLEAIAGLRPVAAGRIALQGIDVTAMTPAHRNVGYVPQDAVLFPRLRVHENLAFALELRQVPGVEIQRRVAELAGWLGIRGILDRYPAGLSGGEAQRVALGRALAFHPPVLLLDEPLSALDEETRDSLLVLLENLKSRREVTVLHVTHHRSEAERLADVIFRIDQGRLVAATPEVMPSPPSTAFRPG